METRTKIVLLMHPKEARRTKCTTGRLACLNLRNSEIICGLDFDSNPRLVSILDDPANFTVLLYPGNDAVDLSSEDGSLDLPPGRRLVVLLVDATWSCSRSLLRANPGLLRLPIVQFKPREPSRWIIKRQPAEYCLSTIESIHELLLALERCGLDSYQDKERLLKVFAAMQSYQLDRALSASADRTHQLLAE